jgi:hypothetical protein
VYRLHYDPAVEAVHDSLPEEARIKLSAALAAACDDPIAATEPYGHTDEYLRLVVTEQAFAVLYLGHTYKTINVLQIHYLG